MLFQRRHEHGPKPPLDVTLLQNSLLRFRFRGAERVLLAARPLLQLPRTMSSNYRGTHLHIDCRSDLQFLNSVHLGGFEHIQLMEALLRPGDTVVDVGANYGYVTCHAARIVGPTGMVLAVEPNPRVSEELLRNVRDNGYAQVRHLPQALSNRIGAARFIVATSDDLSRLENEKANDFGLIPDRRVTVEVTTLDQIVEQQLGDRCVDLVKIDVEGRELHVMQGATRLVARAEACFIFEVNDGALAQNDVTFTQLYDYFVSHEYNVYAIDNASGKLLSAGRSTRLRHVTDPVQRGRFADAFAAPAHRDLGALLAE